MSHPAPHAPQRPRRWSWLLVPAALLASIGIGIPLGSALSGGDDVVLPTPTTITSPTPTTATATTPTAPVGPVDACLVGRWTVVDHTEPYQDVVGNTGSLVGVRRSVEISGDGTQTVTYDGQPATLQLEGGGTGEVAFNGTSTFATTAADGVQSFVQTATDVRYTLTVDGISTPYAEELRQGRRQVSYTCEGSDYVQTAPGYESVMRRVTP